MKLILAEKPSVAKNIADALKVKQKKDGYFEGNNFIVTWAFGHLLQLYDAKDYDAKLSRWNMNYFPFIPNEFRYKVKEASNKKGQRDSGALKQLQIIRTLMKRADVDTIISACDYDREGQIIGDCIIDYIAPPKKICRLLLNEWTPAEIHRGMGNLLQNNQMKPLRDAGIARQWTDWIIGINLTSVATLKYQKGRGKALNIGRVLLPTLKIIYDRDKEIETFIPENYYKLIATFTTKTKKSFEATYIENKQEKFTDKTALEQMIANITNYHGHVVDMQVEQKKEFPPYLFNLSNLQGYITSRYKGWTSDKVLKVAQTLYEKKWITYPRTASTALDESLVSKTAKVLQAVTKDFPYKDEVRFSKSKRIFNSSKVESHSAIIPTYVVPKRLTPDQEIVYSAIKNRFISQFMPIAEYEETQLKLKLLDQVCKGIFYCKGRVQLQEGWKKVEQIQSKDLILPKLSIGEQVEATNLQVTDHVTKPPKYHTEKTLLRIMETCGKGKKDEESNVDEEYLGSVLSGFSIGTPATRAETIKKLKDVGYISNQQKNLICTETGKRLVETFPVTELFNLDFTGRLEKSLADIEKRKANLNDFLQFISSFTNQAVARIKEDKDTLIKEVNKNVPPTPRRDPLGPCPLCGNQVIEGKKGFGCSNWKSGCTFVVWKNDKFLATMKKKVTKTLVKSLLKNKVAFVKGLTSKNGKKFNAYLTYERNEEKNMFSWKMSFEKN
ncbi:DNA topoisomerase [Aquibacillus salsiterrae]|uniref:DNA topoisomerase n=1 Tax=Aquibacillus salsiterrae TaxID=2950439 RepID=A0A9X3WJ26_9BACI|nr:DNA topoisomerase [Aquibacillus salsiterrae]MDC3417976.1 DNA topoisomerase [Aquibacillus salsiterrae]